MKVWIFAITLFLEVLLGGSLVLTLLMPNFRAWPPPSRDSWQYRFTWTLTILSLVGTITVGILDWDTFVFPQWARFLVGIPLLVGGNALALWGVRTLSVHASLGLKGKLVTSGPYRFTRNPQYVGDIIALLGFALLCNSLLASINVLVGALWFVLAPFTEEPWLRKQYGAAYEEYVRKVPRFLL